MVVTHGRRPFDRSWVSNGIIPRVRSRLGTHNVKTINCRAASQARKLEKKANLYEILSLRSKNVGFDEIKKVYRSMALLYHPDVCPPTLKYESTQQFVEVREAYETLSDPVSRRMYDYVLQWSSSRDFGFQKKHVFPKAVWEQQLDGLKRRSHRRSVRKCNKNNNN